MIPFLWLFPPTIIVIVVGLTFLRPVLLRWTPAWASLILFLLAIAIATPMTWILVDWENPHLDIEHVVRIGTPLSVVLVPLVSFLVDWQSPEPRSRFTVGDWVRMVVELIVLWPLCFYASSWVILFSGGYWI